MQGTALRVRTPTQSLGMRFVYRKNDGTLKIGFVPSFFLSFILSCLPYIHSSFLFSVYTLPSFHTVCILSSLGPDIDFMRSLCVCVCVCVRVSKWTSRPIFRGVRKTAKSVYYICYVCLSVCPPALNNSAPIGRISNIFDIYVFFENLSRKFKFH